MVLLNEFNTTHSLIDLIYVLPFLLLFFSSIDLFLFIRTVFLKTDTK